MQILPVKDAFVSGTFHLLEYEPSAEDIFLPEKDSSSAICGVAGCPAGGGPDTWAGSDLNTGLLALCLILVVLYMRKFVTVLPYLVGGIFWWKKFAEMENNMRLGRDRNALVLPALMILCVCSGRLGLIPPSFADGLSAGMNTVAVSGMLLAFLLVRLVIAAVMSSRGGGRGTLSAALGVSSDFEIIFSSVLLALLIPVSLWASCLHFARSVALGVAAFLWLLSVVRRYQIISPGCGQFQAILYLCAVEMISMAMLAASAIALEAV